MKIYVLCIGLLTCVLHAAEVVVPFKRPVPANVSARTSYVAGFLAGVCVSNVVIAGGYAVYPQPVTHGITFFANWVPPIINGWRKNDISIKFCYEHTEAGEDLLSRFSPNKPTTQQKALFCTAYASLRSQLQNHASTDREEESCDEILRSLHISIPSVRKLHNILYDEWEKNYKSLRANDGYMLGTSIAPIIRYAVLKAFGISYASID